MSLRYFSFYFCFPEPFSSFLSEHSVILWRWGDFTFVFLFILCSCWWKEWFLYWFQPEQWIPSPSKTWIPWYFLYNFCILKVSVAVADHGLLLTHLYSILSRFLKHLEWYWNLYLLSSSGIFRGLSARPSSLIK